MPPPHSPVVTAWSRRELETYRDEVLDVYADAMAVDRHAARSRRAILSSHLDRSGLRATAAHGPSGELLGIAYGYLGAPGQWWHDQVRQALTDAQASRWLDGSFEVCELHVRTRWQGRGVGRRLLDTLLGGPPARTAVLTTPDVDSRARAFYRANGWTDLVRALDFPGDPRSFAVLAKELTAPPD